jgi:hypothetical protein
MAEANDLRNVMEATEQSHQHLVEWDRFHRGQFDDPYLPSKDQGALSREYRDLMKRSSLNICGNTVAAVTDRLRVDGYQTTGGAVDATVWGWWQENALDARQSQVYRDALALGDGYAMAMLPAVDGDVPIIRPESPLLLRVIVDDANPDVIRQAAKIVGNRAWLYYPDRVVSFIKDSPPNRSPQWTVVSSVPHPAGVVPIVRFANRLDSTGLSESELQQIAPIQRRINQTIFDRLMVQKWGTWKQRWAAGIDVETDSKGRAVPPFRVGVDQLVVSPNPDAKFGEWSESGITELLSAVEDDIRHAAAITQTPPHLLSPTTIANISAEALVALEAGLASKVAARQAEWGEAWERVLLLAGRMVGVEVPSDAEIIWANLEARSQAQVVDGVVKLKSIGLPMRSLLERLGLTPQQVDATMSAMEAEQRSAAAVNAAAFGVSVNADPVA